MVKIQVLCLSIRVFLLHDLTLESAWVHDVAFSPSGESIAWVAHNSSICAVSSSNPTRITMELTQYLPFRCIIFASESTFLVGV